MARRPHTEQRRAGIVTGLLTAIGAGGHDRATIQANPPSAATPDTE